MKKLLTLFFVFCGLVTFGQVYQLMPQYGYQASRFRFDSTLQIPTVCGVPTLKSNVTKLGAIAFDSCNNRFYTYNPKTATWSQVSGGGGSTDTTSLSARIDARVKYTDTASMLSPYFRRSLSANDTIKTNGRVLELNAKTATKSSILKIDTTGLNGSVNLSGNTASLIVSPTINFLSQVNGANEDYIQIQSGETTIQSVDATNTDGLTISSGNGVFWYSGENDTIGILPRTNGTAGQVLKLQDGAQLVWANDSIGITASDTSVFQRKQLAPYSFQSNGTSAAANGTATTFKDTSGTYTGTIAWTGTTAPSGATNHSYRWTRIGKQVTLNVNLVYATNGGALTALVFDLPSDCPTPSEPAGLTAASQNMYPVLIWTSTSTNTLSAASQRGFLRNNSGNNGYEIVCNFTTHACNSSYVTLTYWTN